MCGFLYNEYVRQYVLIEEILSVLSILFLLIILILDEDDDENVLFLLIVLILDEVGDENEEEEDYKDVDSDECDRNESIEVEDDSDKSNIGY